MTNLLYVDVYILVDFSKKKRTGVRFLRLAISF